MCRRLALIFACIALGAQAGPPSTAPGTTSKLPHIQIDVKAKTVRVECESCNAHQDVGLEFFCVTTGGNEYEAVLRSDARPSNIHLALLMIGLQPGEPVKYSEKDKKWTPPRGPALKINCEWTDKAGKAQHVPAYRLMVNNKTKKEPEPFTWVFVGSQTMDDGKYGADATGYIVSVLNSPLTVIDLPQLIGTALETRQLDRNADLLPEAGVKIWMVIQPAEQKDAPKAEAVEDLGETLIAIDPTGKVSVDGMMVPVDRIREVLANRRVQSKTRVSATKDAPTAVVQQVTDLVNGSTAPVDDPLINSFREKWRAAVAPHDQDLRAAAQAHFEIIESMRREQQKLLDEADRIQREIDDLQKQYQEMTTPRPQGKG